MDDEVQLVDGAPDLLTVGHRGHFVAAAVDPDPGLVGLSGQDRVKDAGRMPREPDVKALVLDAAEALFQLPVRQPAGGDGHRVVGHIEDAAGAEALQQRPRLFDVAHQQVQGAGRHGRLLAVGCLVRGHADGDGAGAVLRVKADGLLDPRRVQLADFPGAFEGKFLHPLP